MGKAVPSWQTFISCSGGSLIIRHLKSGLAEDLEIPWPAKLKRITCEKVRFRAEDLSPLAEYVESGFQDKDIPLLLSFPRLGHLNLSDTKVTGAALPQLAVNRNLNIICGHDRNGIARFRAVQRNNWKKELAFDAEPAEEAMEAVRHFYKVSQEGGQRRSSLVTARYLDYCKAHGYNGVDAGQKVSFSDSSVQPYQGYQVVDVEQITRKKFYVYSESDDMVLSQYRCLVLQTEDGWKIDKNERLTDGKWKLWRLD